MQFVGVHFARLAPTLELETPELQLRTRASLHHSLVWLTWPCFIFLLRICKATVSHRALSGKVPCFIAAWPHGFHLTDTKIFNLIGRFERHLIEQKNTKYIQQLNFCCESNWSQNGTSLILAFPNSYILFEISTNALEFFLGMSKKSSFKRLQF